MASSLACPSVGFHPRAAFRPFQRPAVRCLAAHRQQQLARRQRPCGAPEQQQMVSSTAAAQLAPLLPLLPLLGSAAAAAEDLSLDDVDRDAAYAAEFSQTTGSTDLVVSVLAGSVFLLLLVVTAGVSYLTLKSWLDERQENDDREGSAKKPAAGFRDAAAAPEPEAPKRVRAKREKTKGFGQN